MAQRTIAFSNRKGGSGKTTTAVNVAAALAHRGERVLVIDMDPQAHATLSFGINGTKDKHDLYGLLTNGTNPDEVMMDTYLENLKIIPATRQLAAYEERYAQAMDQRFKVAEIVRGIGDDFKFIVFDTPPTVSLLTLSALIASTEVYVPMQAHFLALEGLAEMVKLIQKLNTVHNPEIGIRGVIPTFSKERTRLSREVLGQIKKSLGEKMLLHPVRENVALAEAPSHGKTIFQYKVKSHGAYDYLRVADMIREER
jgi:chromosome partitioning protein